MPIPSTACGGLNEENGGGGACCEGDVAEGLRGNCGTARVATDGGEDATAAGGGGGGDGGRGAGGCGSRITADTTSSGNTGASPMPAPPRADGTAEDALEAEDMRSSSPPGGCRLEPGATGRNGRFWETKPEQQVLHA